jgi:hypothetical protein
MHTFIWDQTSCVFNVEIWKRPMDVRADFLAGLSGAKDSDDRDPWFFMNFGWFDLDDRGISFCQFEREFGAGLCLIDNKTLDQSELVKLPPPECPYIASKERVELSWRALVIVYAVQSDTKEFHCDYES